MFTKKILFLTVLSASVLFSNNIKAQFVSNSDSAFNAGRPNSGKLWGYMFGDYYVKAQADSLNRGSGSQYSGVPKNRNAFQIRRLYLGYNYNITKKFAAEVLLEAAPGEALTDNKLAFYVKLANLRIKDLWKGTDLILGQVSTPGFSMSSEPIWGYRSVEKTIIDVRGTPSYDLGASLQGKFDPKKGNFGYDLMVGNGTGAKPEGDNYKWLYGDIWGKFLDKKLYVNLYVDYNGMSPVAGMKHSRSMIKGFVAYTVPTFTIGVEAYNNHLKNDNQATEISTGNVDVLSVDASGLSIFVRGTLVKDKLNFFARTDFFNPDNKIDNNRYNKYVGNTGGYSDPSTKENFITAGLDFTPMKNVHLMPNLWLNHYKNQGFATKYDVSDVVARLTFYYVFGK
ncbi:hypothetical protein FW778_11625 [Ginsengibacter hankyongi]|uniref:Phosphate-selective porin O and P n=1 Tax=Ginsengibacter hankyongi TaxID=2607284 RepID=A0A5J5IIM7_9BACT|nr:hypothetical protein [Ginsengibacter hankyongi]KAA9039463.1 hypothetical protein FW778_11625 [Ginsengibacter hankyongi]